MKICRTLIGCYFLFLFLTSCGQENKTFNSADSISPADSNINIENSTDLLSDNQEPVHDTTYALQIDGKKYELVFTHESVPFHEADESTTVRIVENSTHDTLYEKTFDFNTVGQLRHPAPNHYWIALLNSGGGSGYSATLFNIKITPEIVLQPILNFNELSNWVTNRTANEIVFFEGMWNIDRGHEGEEAETHFEGHQQLIYLYKIREDTVIAKEIGVTKTKYDLYTNSTNDSTIQEIKRKEVELLKEIRWEDYD